MIPHDILETLAFILVATQQSCQSGSTLILAGIVNMASIVVEERPSGPR